MSDARAALERLRASTRARVLFVSHASGGGVGRHIQNLAAAIEDDVEILLLAPHPQACVSLRWLRRGEDLSLWFRAREDWDRAAALLEAIGIDRVHFHHVHGLPQEVLALPGRLGCSHDLTLHDYFPACPAYHMTDARGRYCGGDPRCTRCLDAGPAQWPLSVESWRGRFAALLESAQRVIAPSADAGERIRRFFPRVAPVVWPHPEDDCRAAPATMRVLVPGAISPAKGLELLVACARDARERGLALHFRVLGYVARPIGEWPDLPVSVSGEYREGDLDRLVALERGDAFFFPAQCPETYSYTLSTALATALPIVASNLGALPERLARRRNARIVPWDAAAGEMNDALLAFAPATAGEEPAAPRAAASRYRELYLAGLSREPHPALAWPPLDPAWLAEPRGAPALSSLAWLFEDAVRCGRGSSREELRRRVAEADASLAAAQAERAALAESRTALARSAAERSALQAAAERAAAQAAELRRRLERVESSRSWKLTAPLRALARLARGGR